MSSNNVEIAEAYYRALGAKEFQKVEQCLHPEIQFVGPLAEERGREAVLQAAKGFSQLFKTLTIRAKCGSGEQAMIVYDVECEPPIGKISAAVLITVSEGLIIGIECFYDARPFEQKREEIFS